LPAKTAQIPSVITYRVTASGVRPGVRTRRVGRTTGRGGGRVRWYHGRLRLGRSAGVVTPLLRG